MQDHDRENRSAAGLGGWSALVGKARAILGLRALPSTAASDAALVAAPQASPGTSSPEPLRPGRTDFPVTDPAGRQVATIGFERDGDKVTVERTTFINAFRIETDLATADGLAAAAARRGWAELDRFDPEFLPWYCRDCGRVYAQAEWSVNAIFDDDPPWWLDCYRGRCPRGHSRMIAD